LRTYNTVLEHKNMYRYTLERIYLGQKTIIDYIITKQNIGRQNKTKIKL